MIQTAANRMLKNQSVHTPVNTPTPEHRVCPTGFGTNSSERRKLDEVILDPRTPHTWYASIHTWVMNHSVEKHLSLTESWICFIWIHTTSLSMWDPASIQVWCKSVFCVMLPTDRSTKPHRHRNNITCSVNVKTTLCEHKIKIYDVKKYLFIMFLFSHSDELRREISLQILFWWSDDRLIIIKTVNQGQTVPSCI